MTSPKTTLSGIASIVAGLAYAFSQYASGGFAAVNWGVLLTTIITGVGLILAKDFNVSNSPSPAPAAKVTLPPAP
jgi:1,4-dihydroxy-2-naphthoate octaprenyltransferase